MIHRDIIPSLSDHYSGAVQIVVGPRQCGKSTLLASISDHFTEITLDDIQARQLAEKDPALFLQQYPTPLLVDEAQYAPNLFPQIKLLIDQLKRKRLKENIEIDVLFRLTGSNQITMDRNVKESLAGRARYFYLNTLTVHEILNYNPEHSLPDILYRGGWPELYVDTRISARDYLNDYIASYIEKDIVLSSGIQKQREFHLFLSLLAGRTATFIDYTELAKLTGIRSVTIKEWASILERNQLIHFLPPYASNLNKRLVKMPKVYFLDTGLSARLQGWTDATPLLNSPQAGNLFETLVLAEIKKYITNTNKDWKIYLWRTKEKEEIDFLLDVGQNRMIAFDAKLAAQSVSPVKIPKSLQKTIPSIKKIHLITLGKHQTDLSEQCKVIPISELYHFLEQIDQPQD